MSQNTKQIKEIALIAILASVLYVQQLALFFIPNVQFSTLLIVLYTRLFGFKRTMFIIIIHIIVINLFTPFGPVMPIHLVSMFIGWSIIPVVLTTVFRRANSALALAFLGLFFGSAYGMAFIPATVFVLNSPFLPYLIADIPFQVIMACANFITIMWLYDPLKKILIEQKKKYFSPGYNQMQA